MKKPFDGDYPLSQGFGVNPDTYARFFVKQPDGTTAPLRGHNGLDYKVPSGTTIKSPFSGKVIEAAFDKDGYGNYIKIESENEGIVMAHLEKILVSVGALVNEGEAVAVSDNTGYSTGPHLHMGYYRIPRDRSNGYGGFIDPSPYIDGMLSQPVSGPLHTDNEYKACMADREKFWKERDEALATNKVLQEELDTVKGLYSAFDAVGYKTVEDVTNTVNELKTTIEKINVQLVQVQQRNADLADLLKKKEEEDYTAIAEGVKAQRERDQLQDNLNQVKTAVGMKQSIDITHLIDQLLSINSVIKRYRAEKQLSTPEETNTKKGSNPWAFLGLVIVMTMTAGSVLMFLYH